MGKGLNPVALVAAVVAIAALGLSGFMFMQVNKLKSQMVSDGPLPEGVIDGEGGSGGHGAGADGIDYSVEKAEVLYALEKITTRTSDGKFAVLDMTLVIESKYQKEDWDLYMAMMENYGHDLQFYNDFQAGKIDPTTGEYLEDDHAALPIGPMHAAHSAGPTFEPPDEPVEPSRPLTALEKDMARNDARVRDVINNTINSHESGDIIDPEKKKLFKQKMIDELNNAVTPDLGTVLDIYFKEVLVT